MDHTMIKILCKVPNCKLCFDSVAELKKHNKGNHIDYFTALCGSDKVLLKRNIGDVNWQLMTQLNKDFVMNFVMSLRWVNQR